METRTDYPRRAGIAVTLYNGTTAAGTSYVPVNEDVHYWQFLSGKLTATGDYTSVEYAFVYENNGNEAWFDGAQLFREPFDYVYTYDDDGNLTSVKNPDGTTTTYTYVEGTSDVASITMPGGGQYSYTYNDNHQLTRSVTATGLQTDYGYDAFGNSTSVTIRPQNDTGAAIRSDSTYTADGNMLASTTGGDRNTVTYTNDTDRSLVTAVTNAKNAVTSYSYDSMRRQRIRGRLPDFTFAQRRRFLHNVQLLVWRCRTFHGGKDRRDMDACLERLQFRRMDAGAAALRQRPLVEV